MAFALDVTDGVVTPRAHRSRRRRRHPHPGTRDRGRTGRPAVVGGDGPGRCRGDGRRGHAARRSPGERARTARRCSARRSSSCTPSTRRPRRRTGCRHEPSLRATRAAAARGRQGDPARVGRAARHRAGALHRRPRRSAPRTCLHAWPVQVPHAKAQVTDLDVAPAYDVPGVVRVLTADDVPGVNDAGVKHDEPLFPDQVRFFGHAVCWVLGETLEAARLGAAAVIVRGQPGAGADQRQGGHRRRGVPGRSADRRARRRGRRHRRLDPRVQRRARVRGPGALLPRDPLRPRARRRGRPGLRAEQHPAPVGDPGDRRPRAGAAQLAR